MGRKNRPFTIRNKISLSIAVFSLLLAFSFLIFFQISKDTALRESRKRNLTESVAHCADMVHLTSPDDLSAHYIDGLYVLPGQEFSMLWDDISYSLRQGTLNVWGPVKWLPDEIKDRAYIDHYICLIDEARGMNYLCYDQLLRFETESNEPLYVRGVLTWRTEKAETTRQYVIGSLLIILGSVLVYFVSFWIIGRLLSSIRTMEETAVSIQRGEDLKKRIPPGKNDELGNLAKTFNSMLDQLDNSFEREKQFTQELSHGLRNPAAVILAQSEYLTKKQRTEEEYKAGSTAIHLQAMRMQEIINDLLELYRIESRQDQLPVQSVPFSDLVWDVCRMIQQDYPEKQLNASLEEISLCGNAYLLEQLVYNLLDNAAKYTDASGHITVSLFTEGEAVHLKITDDGPGIPPEEKERIFERFYRLENGKKIPGSGLGLSIAQKIAVIHNASINVDSTPGEGSVFTVIFEDVREPL